MYGEMLRIRKLEERIAERYGEQEMRVPAPLSTGKKAVAVGVWAAFEQKDCVFGTPRAHAHYLAKGGDLRALVAELYGRTTGCTGGQGGSMHLIDLKVNMLGATPIVGSTIPVAAGAAFATRLQGGREVTVVYFGDGATEEGVFFEALNFAVLYKLPVLFVCENNLYSVYSPMVVRQPPGRDVVKIVEGHGAKASRGDGNDVDAVYSLAASAVDFLRNGAGPYYLELSTYRWREHCGPNYDNDIGYRSLEEFATWQKLCPVVAYGDRLRGEAILDQATIEIIEAAIEAEIDDAWEFAKDSPRAFPRRERVYASELQP